MKCHAVLIDTVSIQKYVFGSNKLKENLGASYLVQEIYDSLLNKAFAGIFPELKIDLNAWKNNPEKLLIQTHPFEAGYIGGGNALLFFKKENKAKDFIKEWTKILLIDTPGIATAIAYKEFDLEKFKESLKELFKLLRNNKAKYVPQTILPRHGITAECSRSGYSMEIWNYSEKKYISSVTNAKIEASAEAKKELINKFSDLLKEDFTFTDDLEELGQIKEKDSHIAIVHIDGNGMGKRFQGCNSLEEIRRLSISVNKATKNAFRVLLGEIISNFHKQNVNPIPIPEEDVKNYNNDITRAEKVPNLIKLSAKCEVPCFYVKWGKDRISFGHTGMFRLAYDKTIKEHIPEQLQDKNKIDIAESIFGNKESFAGRVFFEDIFIKEGQNNVSMGEKTPKILSSPKPTTFQHYLVQTRDNIRQLNHYNTDSSIRGYKLYWHKSGKTWEEKNLAEIDKHKTQYTRINPVREGIKFAGKIRFENFSDVELGSLLFALDLPQGCCHKLGMGKPLGLGSVKITPKLFLSDRKKRYESLFGEWDINGAGDINKFKKDFEKYILEKTGESKANLWELDRFKDLKAMLNFNIGVTLENQGETDYMQLNEFRNRPILPRPSRIKLRK